MYTDTAVKVGPYLYLLWWGIELAMGHWLLKSALRSFIFIPEFSFFKTSINEHPDKLSMRLLIIALLVGPGYVAGIFLFHQRQMTEYTARLNRLLTCLSEVNQYMQCLFRSEKVLESICKAAWRQPLIECGHQSAATFPVLVQGKSFGSLSVYARDSQP